MAERIAKDTVGPDVQVANELKIQPPTQSQAGHAATK